jgi:hypothetical protein
LYNPVLGMFITPDSVIPDLYDPQKLNRYAYVRNNPIIYVDPSGHVEKEEKRPVCYAEGVDSEGNPYMLFAFEEDVERTLKDIPIESEGLDLFTVIAKDALDASSKAIDEGDLAKQVKFALLGMGAILLEGVTLGGKEKKAEQVVEGVVETGGKKLAKTIATEEGTSATKKTGEILSRLGTSKESVSRLERKATEAENQIGIHGVSTTAGAPKGAASQAARGDVEQAFKVHNTPTRSDPFHRTVELPKPITQQIADLFNSIFGRD